jgi:hypothetical protein
MRYRKQLWTLAVIALFASPHSAQQKLVTVRIVARTTIGDRIENINVELTPITGGQHYSFSGKSDIAVSPGGYILRTEAHGFLSQTQLLKVFEANVLRTVMLPVMVPDAYQQTKINGSVKNYAGNLQDIRIRINSLYGDEVRESNLDSRGMFDIPVEAGSYAVLTLADLDNRLLILDSRFVHIVDNQRITIDLQGRSGESLDLAPLKKR